MPLLETFSKLTINLEDPWNGLNITGITEFKNWREMQLSMYLDCKMSCIIL